MNAATLTLTAEWTRHHAANGEHIASHIITQRGSNINSSSSSHNTTCSSRVTRLDRLNSTRLWGKTPLKSTILGSNMPCHPNPYSPAHFVRMASFSMLLVNGCRKMLSGLNLFQQFECASCSNYVPHENMVSCIQCNNYDRCRYCAS
jgi:hypothetical protein